MNPTTRSILVDYEENGASVEEIQESLGGEITREAIIGILMQFSRKYQRTLEDSSVKDSKDSTKREDITDLEYTRIMEGYKMLGFSTDNERLKAKIFQNLIDEKKGRKDWRDKVRNVGRGISATQLNVFVFNRAIKAAREEKILKVLETSNIVEVEAEEVS